MTPPRVLVDSSLWIDFYRPSCPEAVRRAVSEALNRDAVFTTPLIVTEVVQGAPDEAILQALIEDFSALHFRDATFEIGATAARIGYALRRRGRAVPPPELLIAAHALEAGLELWHRDLHFQDIAAVVPLRERIFQRNRR